ncbi:MAG: peptide chain release factor N(5)-glutamine methyltransferase [Lachnospiraceae bacterium]|nr:peptide chain release factor N(5)-glutamine methyltransferase [Lachnospiraceae bacterium]
MTFEEAYREGIKKLKDAGVQDSDVDARLLLEFVSGKDRTFLLVHGSDMIEDDIYAEYDELIEKRASHIPLQHITKKADFMGLEFETAPNVLIPRFDTEFLVEEAMRYVEDGSRILDMCTGSGCILLSLMKYKNDIVGTAADISDDALALTKRNAEKLGVSPEIIKSSMFENITGEFDYIVSNPPYIPSDDIEGLMSEVRDHDPRLALDGGKDGLEFYRIIANEAGKYLVPEGKVFVEIGYDQGDAVKALFEEAGFIDVEVLKDYAGNERVVKCSKNWKTR